jgi:hypothetical protein
MLVVLVVYQQLENHVVQPVIMARTVELSALTVLVSILIGVELFGFLGALLAIPKGGREYLIDYGGQATSMVSTMAMSRPLHRHTSPVVADKPIGAACARDPGVRLGLRSARPSPRPHLGVLRVASQVCALPRIVPSSSGKAANTASKAS